MVAPVSERLRRRRDRRHKIAQKFPKLIYPVALMRQVDIDQRLVRFEKARDGDALDLVHIEYGFDRPM
jgi:hypothetical protein